jgi:hypothetical protein
MKYRRVQTGGHVDGMGKRRNAYRILVWRRLGVLLIGKLRTSEKGINRMACPQKSAIVIKTVQSIVSHIVSLTILILPCRERVGLPVGLFPELFLPNPYM